MNSMGRLKRLGLNEYEREHLLAGEDFHDLKIGCRLNEKETLLRYEASFV